MKIDFTYLEMVSDGDSDFIQQFVTTFESTCELLIPKLETELADGDLENLGKTAHQLKPSAKMLGLSSGDTLEEIQNSPEKGNADNIAAIKADCEEGLAALKEWAKEKGVTL